MRRDYVVASWSSADLSRPDPPVLMTWMWRPSVLAVHGRCRAVAIDYSRSVAQ